MMQRNETLCLQPWLTYHGHLFGHENLFVIDHGSDDAAVQDTLRIFERLGVTVQRLPASADYREKGTYVSDALARADATHLYDILFPLDCDEFVTMRTGLGRLSCAKDRLIDYLVSLADETAPLLVTENLLNSLNSFGGFWALPYHKIFFTGGNVEEIDHGAHDCMKPAATPVPTRIVYAHYHHKPHAMQIMMSREKLRLRLNIDDPAALAAYRGVGSHLVQNLLRTEAEYMQSMTGGSISFPELPELFGKLGINPGFCDG